ncbi:uncharacterized protein LOC9633518 [Selaginella moellendorffii]|uniref:uncharacterized protein LOC9633518 n=1 Tax=Selaginella moellendorffii TaxID=88036 RepID=UPI000D1C6E7C|nr:uncharacterized protein LOC9633518 [Selaginella moellendorffii]|eukprot:XP_024531521.1 uncharacterized protein LOC9633518 [Selaginella moellendorffii]
MEGCVWAPGMSSWLLPVNRGAFFQLNLCCCGRKAAFRRLRHCSRRNVISAFWQGDQNVRDDGGIDEQRQLLEAFSVKEQTVDSKTPRGELSTAAINAIEQFSRLSGVTGRRMREHFERYAPVSVQNEARNLLEFCCFRFLGRGSGDFIPNLKDAAFRRLTFITMLAWQQPYMEAQEKIQTLVQEPAFARIAPSVPGAADVATAHHLFKALTGDKDGLSFDTWDRYLCELCGVVNGRHIFRQECNLELDRDESLICIGASRRQPVQKWDNGMAWPGNLTMTDRALYFEPFRIAFQDKQTLRLSFDGPEAKIERRRVGPLGMELFDSAISISSSSEDDPWVLEFVDFTGRGRREIWYLFILEMMMVHRFIREYAPKTSETSPEYAYVSKTGRRRAINSALLGIARFQALQATLKKAPEHPEKLLQYSYVSRTAAGFLVLQSLAVDFWGGRMELSSYENSQVSKNNELTSSGYIVGTDGSIYFRKWMDSETWNRAESIAFWRQRLGGGGMVLGKNHVVGGLSQLERAVGECKEQNRELELTKATIDGAIIAGIPENIDLFKELMSPLLAMVMELKKLKEWKEPPKTLAFLACFYGALYLRWLRYVFPSVLLISSIGVLALRGLRASGHVEPDFGKVTIQEQPPSNTLQKIISLKEALAQLETFLQNVNVALLKLRTIALSSNPKATNLALLSVIAAAGLLVTLPFQIIVALLVLDQFTMELKFRRPMVREFLARLKAWWESVPAAPVVVERLEKPDNSLPLLPDNPVIKGDVVMETLNQWFGEK